MKWVRDEEFIRDKVPMTKFDVRIAVIAALAIDKDDIFLDVGAGTGSISIQAALCGAAVYSIEKKEQAIELIEKNARKFKVNVNLLEGEASEILNKVSDFNKCFIGGSGGRLKEIFETINGKLKASGIIAATFIRVKNMNDFCEMLEEYNYLNIEIKLFQVSTVDVLGLMKANNPVFLVRGIKP